MLPRTGVIFNYITLLSFFTGSDFRVAYAANISEHLRDRPPHRELRSLLFSNSVWVLLRPTELIMKSCETGPTVYCPYPRRLLRNSTHLQMSLQRQHFLLSYLKTLSVGPAAH